MYKHVTLLLEDAHLWGRRIPVSFVGCPAERRKRKRRFAWNSSFWQAHAYAILSPTSTYPIVCFICRNFVPNKMLSSTLSCNLIYNASGLWKSWSEFYRLLYFAKHSHCQFSYQAHAFTSFCRAPAGMVYTFYALVSSHFSLYCIHIVTYACHYHTCFNC